MSRIRLLTGIARSLARAAKGSRAQKVGNAALKQASRLKAAAKGAKPIAQKVATEKAKATGKPVRTTINTAARRQTIARQAQRASTQLQRGPNNLTKSGVSRATSNTKLAPGVSSSATKKPPISRTTSPTKAEQVRAVKSGLKDRGQAFAEAQLPKSSRATANQARGNRYSASRNGQGPDPNYGTRQQPKSTTGNNKVEIQGDSRESARNFARERVAAYNAGDPTVQSPARRRGAQQIIKDRVAKETQGMSAAQRQQYKRQLERQANQGERRVRAAAEAQYQRDVKRDRFGRSPSTAQQDYVPTSRDQRRLSDSTRNKMAEEFGKLPKKPLPPTNVTKPSNNYKNIGDVKKGFQQAERAKPPAPKPADKRGLSPDGKVDFANSKLSQTGRVATPPQAEATVKPATRYAPDRNDPTKVVKQKVKPAGQTSIPKSMGVPQRRAEPSVRQNRSDEALRQRNNAISPTPRTPNPASTRNNAVDKFGNNLQKIADQTLRDIGWTGRR
jgi:hypothetical protein